MDVEKLRFRNFPYCFLLHRCIIWMDCSLNEKKRNQNEYMLISINFILFDLGSGPGEFFQPVVFTLKKRGKYGGESD